MKNADLSAIDNLFLIISPTPNNNPITQTAVASILNRNRNAYIGLNDLVNEVSFNDLHNLKTSCRVSIVGTMGQSQITQTGDKHPVATRRVLTRPTETGWDQYVTAL